MAIAYKPFIAMNVNTSKGKDFYTQGQRFAARVLFIVWLLASSSPESILATPKRQPAMTPTPTTSPQGPSLASTPPTPLPGGILQLPPDSPGSFWGDSVASSPSIDAALQQRMSQEAVPDKRRELLRTSPKVSPASENLSFQAREGERVRFYYQMGRQWRAEVSSHIGAFSRQSVLPVVCSQGTDVTSSLEVLSKYPSWYSQRQIHVLDRNVCPTLGEVVYVGELGLRGGQETWIPGPAVNVGNVDEEGAIKCDIPEGKRYKRHEVDVESSEEGVSYTVEYVEAASETLLQRYAQSSRSSSGGGHLSAQVLDTFGAGVSGDVHRGASSSADRLYIGRHSHAAVVVKYKTTKCRTGLLRKAGNAMGVTEKQPTYLRLQVQVEVSDESDAGVQSHPGDSEGASPLLAQSSLDWLSIQIALGKTPDAVYPLIAERLANPQKVFTRSDQIQLLTDCVRYGRANAEAMSGADAVIVLGNTGAGKSTFINYLAGCELEEKWVGGQLEPILEVRGTSSGGERDEVTPIGHGGSKTFMPQIAAVDDQVYCDCPGFSDNRGVEINIANAVNIKQALSQAQSLRLVVLVNYHSLLADRANGFRDLLRTLTDLLGSEAAIFEHQGSILLGISKCFRPNMTCKKLWEGIANYVPESLQCLKECLFLFNPLSPESGWDRAGCLAALDRLAKVSDPSSILSVSLNDSDLYALHSLVDALGEEIASALSGGDLASASARYRSLDRLSVIDHEKIKSLLSSTRSRISSWVREQEGKFRFQYAMHDFEGAKNLLDLLREVSISLGASEVDLASLRAELDSARQAYEVQQAELTSLREALSANAERVESNHSEVLGLFKEQKAVFEQQQAAISVQLQDQELAFGRRMELLEGQLRSQEASYVSRLEEMASAHKSELSRREAEIRQDVQLNAEQQAAALSALQQDLEARYQSEQQAQESRHAQALALLAAERSAAETALNTEKGRLLSEQQSSYEKLLGDLEGELSKLRESLSSSQSELSSQKQRHARVLSDLAAEKSKLEGELSASQSELASQRNLHSKALSDLAVEKASLESAHSQLKSQEVELEQLRRKLSELPSSVVSSTAPVVEQSSSNVRRFLGRFRPQSAQKSQESSAATLSSFGDSVLDASVWERYYGAVDSSPSPPSGIAEILNSPCPFWSGKQVKDTHLLALIPSRVAGKPLTLDYLGELIKSPKGGGHKTQYRGYYVEDIGNQSPGKSYWVLMTRDVLDGSRNKSYKDQCALVARHRGYTVPGVLEAAVVMLLHHVRSGERLYSDSPWTYTRCQESVVVGGDDYSVVVGGFSSGGLFVSSICSFVRNDLGVAGLRKF